MDEVIDILRNAPDGTTAKVQLQERLDLSDRQTDAILSMPLRRLTAMERQSLQTEFEALTTQMKELRRVLGDRRELLKALKKDLRALRKKYADDRRTRIIGVPIQEEVKTTRNKAEIEPQSSKPKTQNPDFSLTLDYAEEAQETVIELTNRGYARRMAPKVYDRLNRSRADNEPTINLEDADEFGVQTQFTTTAQTLVVMTRSGKAYPVKVSDIPQVSGKSRGTPLVTLLPVAAQGMPDSIAGSFILPDDLDDQYLLLLTEQGRLKRLPLSEFADLTGRGLTALKLREEDQLLLISLTQVGEQVVIATSSGRVLRFEVNDEQVPIATRTSQGNAGMRISKKEKIVGWAIATADDTFLMVSEQGHAKQMAIKSLRRANTGEIGIQAFQFTTKTDALIGTVAVLPEALVFLLTNENHLARVAVESIKIGTKDAKGSCIVKLGKSEQITGVSLPILLSDHVEDED